MKKLITICLLLLVSLIAVSCLKNENNEFPYSVSVRFLNDSIPEQAKDSIALWVTTVEEFSTTSYRIENIVEEKNNEINIDLVRLYFEGIAMNCEYGSVRELIYVTLDGDNETYYLNINSGGKSSKAKIIDLDSLIVLKPLRESNATFENDTLYISQP
jgi:hypothetical protein